MTKKVLDVNKEAVGNDLYTVKKIKCTVSKRIFREGEMHRCACSLTVSPKEVELSEKEIQEIAEQVFEQCEVAVDTKLRAE